VPNEQNGSQVTGDEEDPNAGANGDSTDDEDDDDLDSADLEKLREQLRASRKSERQLKRQVTKSTSELEAIRQGQMTEQEKLQKALDDERAERERLQMEIRQRDAQASFVEEAKKQGALRPDALFRLAEIEYDEQNKPVNLKDSVKSLKQTYPELFGAAGSADGGSGRGAAPQGTSMSDRIREQLGRSTR
jgi:ribosomal protein L16 Arg81 hydroxylase